MAQKKNEVAEVKPAEKTFSVVLAEKLEENALALPKDFNQTRFVQNAVALLNDNPDLKNYGTSQVLSGLMRSAFLGLDAMSKEAYLVPRKGRLCYQTSYKGDIKLCKKYSTRPLKDVFAKVVRQGDEFTEKIIDGKPSIDFSPKPFNTGAIIGAFAVALFEDGGMLYDTMSLTELENTRKHSSAPDSPAWKDFKEEMYKKTIIHRLCKHIDLDFESAEQRRLFDNDLDMDFGEQKEAVPDPMDDEEVIETEVIADETDE